VLFRSLYALVCLIASFVLGSPSVQFVIVSLSGAVSIDPIHFVIYAMLAMSFVLVISSVFLTSPCVWILRKYPKRLCFFVHRELRERGIYYCSRWKCRYNCTGITGNTCPECGSTVPGLDAADAAKKTLSGESKKT